MSDPKKPQGKCPDNWVKEEEYIHTDGTVWSKGKFVKRLKKESVATMVDEKPVDKKSEIEDLKLFFSEQLNKIKEESKKSLEEVLEKNRILEESLEITKQSLEKNTTQATNFALSVEEKVIKYVEEKNIPRSDLMEYPDTFWIGCTGFILSSYIDSAGREILPPHGGLIYFTIVASDKKLTNNGEEYISFSKYDCWSKKESEFIRNSPYYKSRQITERSQDHLTPQSAKRMQFYNIMTKYSNIEPQFIIQQSKLAGFDINTDVSELRVLLAEKEYNEKVVMVSEKENELAKSLDFENAHMKE